MVLEHYEWVSQLYHATVLTVHRMGTVETKMHLMFTS